MKKFLLVLILIFISIPLIHAQTEPTRDQTRDTVLQAMSQRLGVAVTENSFSYRYWYFGDYGYVNQNGCVGAPATAPTTGNWQRFEYTYQGTVFVYLVSENLQSVILCNESAMPSAGATAVPQATATPIVIAPTQAFQPLPTVSANTGLSCTLSPRLQVGGSGEVTPGDPNWVHISPSRDSTKIGEVPGQGQFNVVGGPTCDTTTGMIFWLVEYNSVRGWTSEGLNGEYWLVPITATAFNAANLPLATAPQWFGAYPDTSVIRVASNPADPQIAVGDDVGNVWLWSTTTNQNIYSIGLQSPITVLEYSPDGAFLMIGTEDGRVQLVELGELTPVPTLNFQHQGAVTAIAYSSNVVIVGDTANNLTFWQAANNTIPALSLSLPEPASSLEFTQDGFTLIARNANGFLLTALQIPR